MPITMDSWPKLLYVTYWESSGRIFGTAKRYYVQDGNNFIALGSGGSWWGQGGFWIGLQRQNKEMAEAIAAHLVRNFTAKTT